jgi:hypothetical protein
VDRGEFDEDAEDERLLQAKAAEVGGSVWCAVSACAAWQHMWRSELYYTGCYTMLPISRWAPEVVGRVKGELPAVVSVHEPVSVCVCVWSVSHLSSRLLTQ